MSNDEAILLGLMMEEQAMREATYIGMVIAVIVAIVCFVLYRVIQTKKPSEGFWNKPRVSFMAPTWTIFVIQSLDYFLEVADVGLHKGSMVAYAILVFLVVYFQGMKSYPEQARKIFLKKEMSDAAKMAKVEASVHFMTDKVRGINEFLVFFFGVSATYGFLKSFLLLIAS